MRVCTNCVMDETDPLITFDQNGVCNHCREYPEKERKHVFKGAEGERKLAETIADIKENGKGKEYDCVLGVSGGVDSTYLAYLAKKQGLRPLIVHFDNGWNSELSVNNIENIVNKLDYNLFTYVIDWNEFKDLQLAFMKASVIDIEMLTDHAIIGTLYRLADKHNVKYLLSGFNIVTEGILPKSWIWNKYDAVNIKDIHRIYGTRPLKTFPFFDLKEKKKYISLKGITTVPLLNYVDYNKQQVKELITKELGWRDYGGKHYESVFTKFYQGFILPNKFNVDKRKAHLSTLICSGQITREEALQELSKPIYDPEELKQDKVYVLKKLGVTEEWFEEYMNAPPVPHDAFKTDSGSMFLKYPLLKPFKPIVKAILKRK